MEDERAQLRWTAQEVRGVGSERLNFRWPMLLQEVGAGMEHRVAAALGVEMRKMGEGRSLGCHFTPTSEPLNGGKPQKGEGLFPPLRGGPR